MKKEFYTEPEMKITAFSSDDVITSSGDNVTESGGSINDH